MGRLFEKVLIGILLMLVVLLALGLLVVSDFTGFFPVHDTLLPEGLRQTEVVKEYIKFAEINALAPKDQKAKLLEEKERYVEQLLSKMKLESTRILEEKQRLEFAFRELEERRNELAVQRKNFESRIEADRQKKEIENSQALKDRLDKLAAMYAKIAPEVAAGMLVRMGANKSYEILTRLKPKTLAQILENMNNDEERKDFLEVLQSQKPPAMGGVVNPPTP